MDLLPSLIAYNMKWKCLYCTGMTPPFSPFAVITSPIKFAIQEKLI